MTAAPDYYLNAGWLSAIMKTVDKLVMDLDSILQLSSMLDGVNMKDLAKYLPKLQNFANSAGPDVVIDEWVILNYTTEKIIFAWFHKFTG